MKQKGEGRINYSKEKQGELFGEFQAAQPKRPAHSFRRGVMFGKRVALNLSYENIVLLFIALIMFFVVFFSLGVEKGKRFTLQRGNAPAVSYAARLTEEKPQAEKPAVADITAKAQQINEPKTAASKENPERLQSLSPKKPYTIQVIAFKKEKNVKKEIERLENSGFETFVIPSGEWLQICVGRYVNKAESKENLESLKDKYPTCFFRRIDDKL